MDVIGVAFTQAVIVPIIIAIVQALKRAIPRLEDAAMILAIAIGAALGLAWSAREGDPVGYALAGLIAGVAAAKTYDVGKDAAQRVSNTTTAMLGHIIPTTLRL